MLYWDASALVSLCIDEEPTSALRSLLGNGILTRAVSRVDVASARERRSREKDRDPGQRLRAMKALD